MAYTAIDDPGLYFNTIIYTGDGSTKTISGVGFQPDLVWGKGRNSDSAQLVTDSVRGATKTLYTNTTAAEVTSATDNLTGFTSDGYTVNSASNYNVNTRTQVNWNWKESATAGFDIVAYEGTGSTRTVAHSLSAVPYMMIIKNLENTGGSGTEAWLVYHKSIGATHKAGSLDDTGVPHDHTDYFNDTEPTSSVFTVGPGDNGNNSGEDNIAYLFAPKQGFSKFGEYPGNGNANGDFVFLGFRPAMVIIKGDNTENWSMYDDQRVGYNVDNNVLYPNDSSVEGTSDDIDFLSNGFKIRRATGLLNDDGVGYIYCAWAKAPFVNSEGVPCNAR